MELNNLEDRLECAIAHINTSVDIDPWAQNLAVESMRMRIALMNGGQPEIIRCRDCYYSVEENNGKYWCNHPQRIAIFVNPTDYCSKGVRRTDEPD